GSRDIDRCEVAPGQKKTVRPPASIYKNTHDLAGVIDSKCCGTPGPREINRGEVALRQKKAVSPETILERPNNVAEVIDSQGKVNETIGAGDRDEVRAGQKKPLKYPTFRCKSSHNLTGVINSIRLS